MKKQNNIAHLWLSSVLLAAVLCPMVAEAAAGKFQFVSGDVKIRTTAGAERVASKGGEIDEGDLIVSGKPAMAQLRMNDGGIIVIRPSTRFLVRTFRYNGKEDGSERALFELERGSVRAITGEIGKTNKKNYLIQTPNASIGVRGTDHEPYFIPEPAPGETPVGPPGTYDKVNVGQTYIQTQKGIVVVNPSKVGFAADANSVPEILPNIPEFYNFAAVQSGTGKSGQKSASKSKVGAGSSDGSDSPSVVQAIKAANGVNLTTSSVATPPPVVPPGGAIKSAGAYVSVEGNNFNRATTARPIVFTPKGQAAADQGGIAALGIDWGRWDDFTVDNRNTLGALQFIHSTMPTSVLTPPNVPITATYNYAGGPAPSNQMGQLGVINSLTADVNFSTAKVTNYAVDVSVSNTRWYAQGSGTFGEFLNSASGLKLNGTCSGCAGAPAASATGDAKGVFVGPSAEGLISSFGLQSGQNAVVGVGALKR